jgi:ADP-ribose pyrophosphatase YjhB (NUDIX family)
VLPKGHIEAGETPERAAVREVEEEAGVRAEIVRLLGDVDRPGRGQRIRVFAMRALHEGAPREGRRSAWLPPAAAAATASSAWARRLILEAADYSNGSGPGT